jgi:hypothetical protein
MMSVVEGRSERPQSESSGYPMTISQIRKGGSYAATVVPLIHNSDRKLVRKQSLVPVSAFTLDGNTFKNHPATKRPLCIMNDSPFDQPRCHCSASA